MKHESLHSIGPDINNQWLTNDIFKRVQFVTTDSAHSLASRLGLEPETSTLGVKCLTTAPMVHDITRVLNRAEIAGNKQEGTSKKDRKSYELREHGAQQQPGNLPVPLFDNLSQSSVTTCPL